MRAKTTKAEIAVPVGRRESENVSIRQIENGYLLERSGCDAKGNYKSTTTYCAEKPKIMAEPTKKGKTK